MNVRTIASLLRGARLPLLLRLKSIFTTFYRLCFLASMADSVLLQRLSQGPVTLEGLPGVFVETPALRSATEAWLGLGVRLGVLRQDHAGYSLRGFLARRLADPGNDAVRALVREVAGLHHLYILQTPDKLSRAQVWDPAREHREFGDLIARSSRTLEPFLFEVIDRVFPASGPVRLLEVGCGHAGCILHAAGRNDALSAVGLELDPQVAAMALRSVQDGGLHDRVRIEVEDVRRFHPPGPFDIVTLYNNIYYFPVEERAGLLRHLHGLLGPGGRIVLTTGCTHGSIEFELVNLIHASTRGWGRLPGKDELLRQLSEAGFVHARATELIPGNGYFAFIGRRGE